MDTNTKKQRIKSSKPSLGKGIGHMVSTDPFLDWSIILAVSLIVTLALVWADISAYIASESRLSSSLGGPGPRVSAPIDAAALSRTLDDFAFRAKQRADVLYRFAPPRDPSLP